MLLHEHMHWCKWLLKHSLQLCELVAHLIVVDFFYTKHTINYYFRITIHY